MCALSVKTECMLKMISYSRAETDERQGQLRETWDTGLRSSSYCHDGLLKSWNKEKSVLI